MLGSLMKQLIGIPLPNSSHPYSFTKYRRTLSSVFPYSGSLGCSNIVFVIKVYLNCSHDDAIKNRTQFPVCDHAWFTPTSAA
jgi:hypothetical protein